MGGGGRRRRKWEPNHGAGGMDHSGTDGGGAALPVEID